MADHRPDIYRDGRGWVLRASSLGSCSQALVRTALGQTPAPWPDNILTAMAKGVEMEEQVMKWGLKKAGYRALNRHELGVQYGKVGEDGQVELEVKVGKNVVRCHPDGIAKKYRGKVGDEDMGGRRVVEVKVMKKGNDPQKGNARYDWQFSVEMLSTGLPMLLVIGWKGEDGEVREEDVEVREIDAPKFGMVELKKRVAGIVKQVGEAEDGKGLPLCDVKQYPCGFWAEHDGTGVWAEEDEGWEDEGEDVEVEVWLADLENAKAEKKKWEEVEKEMKAKVVEKFGWGRKVKVSGWRVELGEVEVGEKVVKGYTRRTVSVKREKGRG